MANINEILQRAASLRDETALNSISPERAGGIMYDTLIALNELWLQQGSALVISKIYASVSAMEADTAPVSDLTGQPLRPGQIVVIASSDSDNGSVYRYNGTTSPSWASVGKIGNLEPVDSLDSDSTSLPLAAHQGKVLDGKISQLGQKVDKIPWVLGEYLDISGDIAYYEYAMRSPFLYAKNGVVCKGLSAFTGSDNAFIFFYDSNYNYLGRKAGTPGLSIDYTLDSNDFPEGTTFFRVHADINNAASIDNWVELVVESIPVNKITKFDKWYNGYYLGLQGELENYEYAKVSGFIYAKAGIHIYNVRAFTGSDNAFIFFYGKNFDFLGYKQGEPGIAINYTLEPSDFPNGTVYFRVHTEISLNAYIEDSTPTVIEMYPAANGEKVAFVSTNGSNENDGSFEHPFATFQHAVNNGFQTIIGMPGYYKGQSLSISGKSGIKILCYNNGTSQDTFLSNLNRRARIVFDNSNVVEGLVLDSDSGLYRVAMAISSSSKWYKVFISHELTPESEWYRSTSYNAILWEIGSDVSKNKKMVPVLSLSDCQNMPGSFYHDGNYLYVNPTTTLCEYRTIANDDEDLDLFVINESNDVEISNVDFMFMPRRALYVYQSTGVKIADCDFGCTAYWSGFEAYRADVVLERCNAYNARIDGFGIQSEGDVSLYDCNGLYNFDDGVSHHYLSIGIIRGGSWIGNVKGGICPAYGSQVNIDGVLCKGNGVGIYLLQRASEYPTLVTDVKSIVSNCISVNNIQYDIQTIEYNSVIMNCAFETYSFDANKTTEQYNNKPLGD